MPCPEATYCPSLKDTNVFRSAFSGLKRPFSLFVGFSSHSLSFPPLNIHASDYESRSQCLGQLVCVCWSFGYFKAMVEESTYALPFQYPKEYLGSCNRLGLLALNGWIALL